MIRQRSQPRFERHARFIGQIARHVMALARERGDPIERRADLLHAPRDDQLDRRAVEPRIARPGRAGVVEKDEGVEHARRLLEHQN